MSMKPDKKPNGSCHFVSYYIYTFYFRDLQEVVSFFSIYIYVIYHTPICFIVMLIGEGNNRHSLCLILVSYECIYMCIYIYVS